MSAIDLITTKPSDRVALRGVRIRSHVTGLSAKTVVEQTFINREPTAIEAVYTFPLPDGAAVCGFEIITGDRVLSGIIEETEQANEQYEQAISQGNAAYILERDRPDVFTLRVGNLKPNQAATIRITYVVTLDRVDKQIRLSFPTTVAPRYATATGMDPIDAAVDGDALNPPHVLSVPYGLTLDVELDLGREIKSISSPSHAIRSDGNHITFAAGISEMNRDVVFAIDLAKEHDPVAQVGTRGSGVEKYIAVSFLPEFDEDELANPQPVETVFVLDCSGSMNGESIVQASAALQLCLRSMNKGDTFNICRFGSNFELMNSEPVPYTQETLDRALKYVACSADLGGTELLAPLKAILSIRPRAGTVRQIVLLTDGQVANEPAIIALARKHRATNRIFTFGIGAASSSFLVKGLARASGGAAEFIAYGERIEEKVLRVFSRIATPALTDVEIDWGGKEVQTLAELPAVFDGDLMTVFGRVPGGLPSQVSLRCKTASGPKNWSVKVPQAPAESDGVIATMWARRMIQSIEEVNNIQRSVHASADSRERKMLVDLSKEFGLLSALTSYIAVEHRSEAERNDGQPALRRVPVMLAEGWGGVMAGGAGGPPMAAPAACAAPQRAGIMAFRRRGSSRGISSLFGAVRKMASPSAPPPSQSMPMPMVDRDCDTRSVPLDTLNELASEQSVDPLHELLGLQSADGWFDPKPVHEIGKRLTPDWDALLARVEKTIPKDKRVRATVLAVLLLDVKFADRKEQSRRARSKAVRYLSEQMSKDVSEIEGVLVSLR